MIAMQEYGMKTNFDELHEYQTWMDSYDIICSSKKQTNIYMDKTLNQDDVKTTY